MLSYRMCRSDGTGSAELCRVLASLAHFFWISRYPGVACQRKSPFIKGLFSTVHVYFLKRIQGQGSPEFSTWHSESKTFACNLYIPQQL